MWVAVSPPQASLSAGTVSLSQWTAATGDKSISSTTLNLHDIESMQDRFISYISATTGDTRGRLRYKHHIIQNMFTQYSTELLLIQT